MDPSLSRIAASRGRLPRTRGDGPGVTVSGAIFDRAPPHPRGWTQRDPGMAFYAKGSPAPAGMDPALRMSTQWPMGLHCPIGDGNSALVLRLMQYICGQAQ